LAFAALALVGFGAYDSYPIKVSPYGMLFKGARLELTLTHYRPAIPFGNRKKYFRVSFSFSFDILKNITPLYT